MGSETFTAAGAPWVPQEWLFSVLVAFTTDHHLFLLFAILVSAMPPLALWLVFTRSRDDALPATGIALAFCGFALAASFGVRAQVLGWAFFAALLLLLERRDRWYWAAIPLTIAWANIHASAAVVPVIVLARLVAVASEGGLRAVRTSRDLLLLPAVLLALVCTPLGLRLPIYALTLAHSPIRHYILEWQPSGLGDFAFMYGAVPLAIGILFGGRAALLGRRLQSFPAALLFAAALFAGRNVPLFAIAAAPLFAFALTSRLPLLSRLNERMKELEPVALVAVVAMIGASAWLQHQRQQQDPPRLPLAAIASVASDGADHRVLCENFTWCSVALGYPRLRVFIDGRCDPYPLNVWQQYMATISGKSPNAALRRYDVDRVIATRGSTVAKQLTADSAWRVAFTDRNYVVFRRE
ncbi:MAG: hypothetical protein WBD57_10685 [Candidatus Cybelea sp.]